MGSKPRHFMKVGMNQKRVARLDRLLSKACSRAQKEFRDGEDDEDPID